MSPGTRILPLFIALLSCHAAIPEPRSLADQVRAARMVKVTVYRVEGRDQVELDFSGPEEIADLARLLVFEGEARPRSEGDLASSVGADLEVVSTDGRARVLQLRADRVFYGPEHAYEAKLENDALYRHLCGRAKESGR